MEFVTNKINIKIDSVNYELTHPKVKDIKNLTKKGDEPDIDTVINLVISCGLPEEIVENLYVEHLNQIVEVLMGKNLGK